MPVDSEASLGMDTAPPGFDPHRWWNSATYTISANVFEQLLSVDPQKGTLLPQLAATLPTTENGNMRYVFRLKRDVRFHTGRELTAYDVKFSIKRLISPETRAEARALYTSLSIRGIDDFITGRSRDLRGIAVLDRYTFTIELDRPDSALLAQLAYPAAAILPEEESRRSQDAVNWRPVGTGPYRISHVVPGSFARLERFDGHRSADEVTIAAVLVRFRVPQEVSVDRILSGSQDFMYEPLGPNEADRILRADNSDAKIMRAEENCCYFLVLSVKHSILRQLEIRQAIAMAIDKEKLVRSLRGTARPAYGGLFSPLSPYYQANVAYPHDTSRARELLKSAADVGQAELTLLSTNLTPEREMSSLIAEDLTGIGLNVHEKVLKYNEKASLSIRSPVCLSQCDWHMAVPHGAHLMDAGFTRAGLDGGGNYSAWSDAAFEELARRGHQAVSSDEQRALYQEMDRIVVRDRALWVPLIYHQRADLVSGRVGNFRPAVFPSPLIKFFARYRLTV